MAYEDDYAKGHYVDGPALRQFWTRLKSYFVKAEDGKGLSTNDFTDKYKAKLDTEPIYLIDQQSSALSVKASTGTIYGTLSLPAGHIYVVNAFGSYVPSSSASNSVLINIYDADENEICTGTGYATGTNARRANATTIVDTRDAMDNVTVNGRVYNGAAGTLAAGAYIKAVSVG